MSPKPATRERGAAAVEMALVLPLLILLVFGILDFSRIFNGQLQITQAAREGVRLASLAPNYTNAQAIDRAVLAAGHPAFTDTDATVVVTKSCPNADDYAEVKVSFQFQGILYPTSPKTYYQTATMRCGG